MAFTKSYLLCHRYFNYSLVNRSKVLLGFCNANKYPSNIQFFHSVPNQKVESKLKKKDSVSDDFHIIYRAPYEFYCKGCYGLTTFSATVIPTVFSTFFFTYGFQQFPVMLEGIEIAKSSTEVIVYALGLVLAISQICLVLFRYPFRIYRHSSGKKYILIYQHVLPWKNVKEEMLSGELKKTERSLMPWHDSLYEFRNRKAILMLNHFHKPSDLDLMMKKENSKSVE